MEPWVGYSTCISFNFDFWCKNNNKKSFIFVIKLLYLIVITPDITLVQWVAYNNKNIHYDSSKKKENVSIIYILIYDIVTYLDVWFSRGVFYMRLFKQCIHDFHTASVARSYPLVNVPTRRYVAHSSLDYLNEWISTVQFYNAGASWSSAPC